MSIMSDIIQRIEIGKQSVIPAVIKGLITDNEQKKQRMITNYNRYKVEHDAVPIFTRKFEVENKINRQLNDTFDSDIIDVKVGYMLGNPIIYNLDPEKYTVGEVVNVEAIKKDKSVIDDFNKRNNIPFLDSETLKMASVCSYGARLLYINTDGIESVMNVDPWECIFVKDGSLNEVQYALRYYAITSDQDKKKHIYVEFYDKENVYYYISSDVIDDQTRKSDIIFVPYQKNGKTEQPHMFEGVPLIRFENNTELQGDCDKVYTLIDAYDAGISDISSEIEQFRLAYMAFYGIAPDEEVMKQAKKTGAFGMPDADCRIEFVTKNLNNTAVENLLDRLSDNIYKFAKSVNFSDEAFSGNVSGVAMKYKMFGLESKSITSERNFTSALNNMYKILCSAWKTKGTVIDYMNITYVWTRNFPLNLLDESQTTMNLKGNISDKTRLGLLSFIDDPEKELKQMAIENEGMVDLNTEEYDEEGNLIEGNIGGDVINESSTRKGELTRGDNVNKD
jgi:SPP1 family phage portal protein